MMRGTGSWILAAVLLAGLVAPLAASGAAAAGSPRTAKGGVRAHGDFNGDGYADLAIGVGYENVDNVPDAGAVQVLYGSASGLTAAGNQEFTQNTLGMLGGPAANAAKFGFAVAVGDFNHDGYADLAIGVARDRFTPQAAGVSILYGSAAGLTVTGNQYFDENTPGMVGLGEQAGDRFGYTVFVGDFNGDGYDDLAIGVPYKDVLAKTDAGAVHILYGSASGLTVAGNQEFTQNTPGLFGNGADRNALFGRAIAAGDFNGDGYSDLAVGAPAENISGFTGAGAVNVMYGSPSGLQVAGSQFFSQDGANMPDQAETSDNFGLGLSAGDYNGDGYSDLAIGVPLEDLGSISNTGAVHVLYGGPGKLTAVGSQFWNLQSSGLKGGANNNDYMGSALASADFNNDGYDDLAIGDSEKTVDGNTISGAVTVIYGSRRGLRVLGNQLFTADTLGIGIGAQHDQKFGYAVAGADFNGDGYADLAIGIRAQDVGSVVDAGAVEILNGGPATGLTTAGSQYWTQDSPGVLDQAEYDDRFGRALPFS